MLRPSHPGPRFPRSSDECGEKPRPRLNLLLSHRLGRDDAAAPAGRPDAWALVQLPRLLEPLGIRSIHAQSGEEAASVIADEPVHIAVIDFTVPLRSDANPIAGGARVLQLLRRLETPPPMVLVRPPQPTNREHVRSLSDALREGAFAVLDRPLQLEVMLEVLRRILRRYYADNWPRS